MHFTSLNIFLLHKGTMPWTPVKGFAPGPHQRALYTIGGPESHSWVLALDFQENVGKRYAPNCANENHPLVRHVFNKT